MSKFLDLYLHSFVKTARNPLEDIVLQQNQRVFGQPDPGQVALQGASEGAAAQTVVNGAQVGAAPAPVAAPAPAPVAPAPAPAAPAPSMGAQLTQNAAAAGPQNLNDLDTPSFLRGGKLPQGVMAPPTAPANPLPAQAPEPVPMGNKVYNAGVQAKQQLVGAQPLPRSATFGPRRVNATGALVQDGGAPPLGRGNVSPAPAPAPAPAPVTPGVNLNMLRNGPEDVLPPTAGGGPAVPTGGAVPPPSGSTPPPVGPGAMPKGGPGGFWNTPFKDTVPKMWESSGAGSAVQDKVVKPMMQVGNLNVSDATKSVGAKASQLAKTVVDTVKAAPGAVKNMTPKSLVTGAGAAAMGAGGMAATVGKGVLGGAAANYALNSALPVANTEATQDAGQGQGVFGSGFDAKNYMGEVWNNIRQQAVDTGTGAGAGAAQAGPAGIIPGAIAGAATNVGGSAYDILSAPVQMDRISDATQDTINQTGKMETAMMQKIKANPQLKIQGNKVMYGASGIPVRNLAVREGKVFDQSGAERTIGPDGKLLAAGAAPIVAPQAPAPTPIPAPQAPAPTPTAPSQSVSVPTTTTPPPQAVPAAPQGPEYGKLQNIPGKGWGAWMPSQSGDRFVAQTPPAHVAMDSKIQGFSKMSPQQRNQALESAVHGKAPAPQNIVDRVKALTEKSGKTTHTPYGDIKMTMPDPQKQLNYS